MRTILVVEDNDVLREDVAEILGLANYKVILAINGKDGLEKISESVPDLVVSDIAMPIIDGLGMLHVLRNDPKTVNLPVIMLTSKHERSDFRNAMDIGADDYITKPFNGDELLKAIENRFKKISVLKEELSHKIKNNLDATLLADNNNITSETLEKLSENRDTNVYFKKQVIYKEGHMPHYLYYIISGKVRTYKTHEDGKQLTIDLYNMGDFLGYIPLLGEAAYIETAEAMEETELALIPRKEFEELIHKNPMVQKKLIKMLAKNIVENEQHLLGIAYNTLRMKVAAALTSLYEKFKPKKNEPFYIDISRDELASIAGTATESLIRTLTEFRHENLIDIKRDNKIEILNAKKLAGLVR